MGISACVFIKKRIALINVTGKNACATLHISTKMIDAIIAYSVRNKLIIILFVLALIGWGSYSLTQLPIDAVPDITNNQVQVVTVTPDLSAQEVERSITVPLELALRNLPNVIELRSISRFGFSMITIVFEDGAGTYLPRQLVSQQLKIAESDIPPELGKPEMTPISTGLGEIYQYVLHVTEDATKEYSPMELRSIQDWDVRRQLSGIEGVVEVNSFGGFLKQYEVAINPEQLKAMNITITEIYNALALSNENIGGAYIEKDPNAYFIRSEGLVESLADIENIVVKVRNNIPVLIRDVAKVQFGHAPRFGALTRNGDGEVVGGIVMMLKGENAAQVTARIKKRVAEIQKTLPEGVIIDPFLVRDKLVGRTINTVKTNLIEGGLIVVFVLVLLLGNWRAGLIVASVIPLAMLFAIAMMRVFGVSANLMSLGAIDFGLVVDGAVIIVESIIHRLTLAYAGQRITQSQMDNNVLSASTKIRKSAAFGELIILIVYLPILTLVGIEGKMFKPMAQTVGFAIMGALILSMTYIPMMSALFLSKYITDKRTIADRIMTAMKKVYLPIIHLALRFKNLVVTFTMIILVISIWQFSRLGGEFLPTLEEGDLALHQILPPGSSLEKSVEISGKLQTMLMEEFPEVEQVVTKIGTAEIPTDLMSIETGDIIVTLKDKSEWTSASTLNELFEKMEAKMTELPGILYEFQQPIEMRFNELMTGSRADVAIKIYGDDLEILFEKGNEVSSLIRDLEGVASVSVEQIIGMPQVVIQYDYPKLAQYGLQVKTVNDVIKTAYAGKVAGTVFEGEKRFDLVVRLDKGFRKDIEGIQRLYIPLTNGQQIPLSEVANVGLKEAPMMISRDDARRRITVGVNVGDKDVATLVEDIQGVLGTKLDLPSGYYITYGGQFENLQAAQKRLSIVVPLALLLIFVLLYLTFNSFGQAVLIFTAIPMAAIGGVWGLVLRDMPFSISAGIGFIALFGVAVLNGIVLIGYFNELEKEGMNNIKERILKGVEVRFRPVIMTAAVASLGFLPMALSHSDGAEVQRPLATVVIAGLITSTFLTLVVLPVLYSWWSNIRVPKKTLSVILILGMVQFGFAQDTISIDSAIQLAIQNHPTMRTADLKIAQKKALLGAGFQLEKTEFYYEGTALGQANDNLQNDIGFRQRFQLPKVYEYKDDLYRAEHNIAKVGKRLTEREIKHKMLALYFDLAQLNAQTELYEQQDSLYQAFLKWANLRYEQGEGDKGEVLFLEKELQLLSFSKKENNNQIEILQSQFQYWLQSDTKIQLNKDFLFEEIKPLEGVHPYFDYLVHQIEVNKTLKNIVESSLLPEFTIGYAVQVFNGANVYSGVEVGFHIPLHRKPIQQKIQAAEIGIEASKSEVTKFRHAMESKYRALEIALEKHELNYEEAALNISKIQDVADFQWNKYQLGELDYWEYNQTLEELMVFKLKRLGLIKRWLDTMLELTFLEE